MQTHKTAENARPFSVKCFFFVFFLQRHCQQNPRPMLVRQKKKGVCVCGGGGGVKVCCTCALG